MPSLKQRLLSAIEAAPDYKLEKLLMILESWITIKYLKLSKITTPQALKKELVGNLAGSYSRRINIQHRLVYEVFDAEKMIKILRMWTHYE